MFAFLQQQRHNVTARNGFRALAEMNSDTLNDVGTSRSAMIEMGHVPAYMIDTPGLELTRALARSTGG